MRMVNIADLKNRLSTYLQLVRSGEEVIVKDRNEPIARILAYDAAGLSLEERQLVASGVLKIPEKDTTDWDKFWDEFFALPSTSLNQERAIRTVIEEREEGW